MIKYFSKAFKITNDNIILATPLVLSIFIFFVYMGVIHSSIRNIYTALLLPITFLFMISAFCAGWFYMVQKAIDLDKQEFPSEEERAKASLSLMREIPIGVGEYFSSFLGGLILYYGLLLVLIFISSHIGAHFAGTLDFNVQDLKKILASVESMKTFVFGLNKTQLYNIFIWSLLFIFTTAFYSFITMFWAAVIVNGEKNPFISFFKSVKFEFKNFLDSFILFLYITFVHFSVSVVNAAFSANSILYFISMLIYFYFVVYVVVVVFLYHDSKNSKIKDICDCGTDCIG